MLKAFLSKPTLRTPEVHNCMYISSTRHTIIIPCPASLGYIRSKFLHQSVGKRRSKNGKIKFGRTAYFDRRYSPGMTICVEDSNTPEQPQVCQERGWGWGEIEWLKRARAELEGVKGREKDSFSHSHGVGVLGEGWGDLEDFISEADEMWWFAGEEGGSSGGCAGGCLVVVVGGSGSGGNHCGGFLLCFFFLFREMSGWLKR